ncbi:hypothetical protein OROGR_015451 [Orobanche gracilis]
MYGNGESGPLVLEDLNDVMGEDDLGSFGRDETISILESEDFIEPPTCTNEDPLPNLPPLVTVIFIPRRIKENAPDIDIVKLDALKWWKDSSKYKILSRLAADILAIPISTVASESTSSAGTRVIDSYRASLAQKTVEMLMCKGDWCRKLHVKLDNPFVIGLPNV